jgi:hypothetical protein
MSDPLSVSSLQRRPEHRVLACERLDPWACSDLYTMRCGAGCSADRDEKRAIKGVSTKTTKSVKGGVAMAKKPAGKKKKGQKPKPKPKDKKC